MSPRVLQKYLGSRGIDGPWVLEGAQGGPFYGAVVIPALAEEQALPQTLAALAANPPASLARFLILVVVNHRVGAPAALRAENLRTLERLRRGDPAWQGLHTAWVDAASAGRELPDRDGVGLARKIGMDLALAHVDWSAVPILVSLDADTLVQPNYLPALERHFRGSPLGAAVIPFAHQHGPTPELERAITLYELYLRHYVLGLELAGSPYAYHSIGSAFACRADAYVAAGGMNRRLGGEDFYFLQQLAKTCGVGKVCGTLVRPSPRISARTPFGTGPAVAALQSGQKADALFYPRQSFDVLGRWLHLVDEQLENPRADVLNEACSLSSQLGDFLERSGFGDAWPGLCRQHGRSAARLRRAFHQWFDGLKTRQLVFALSEEGRLRDRAEVVLPQLLARAGIPCDGDVGTYLAVLRARQNSDST